MLTAAEIRAIARALAAELRSGSRSPAECDANEQSESTDLIDTETDGESSSPDQIAARLLSRSRRSRRPKPLQLPLASKPKVAR